MTRRNPGTRRDRRPRREQGDKAPRSLDYPGDVDGATDYLLKGIDPAMLKKFKARAAQEAPPKSIRWTLLRFMEKYGAGEVTL